MKKQIQELDQLLDSMWIDFMALNPDAKKISEIFKNENEEIINDHVAFRTMNHPKLGIDSIAQYFTSLGYEEKNTYHFKEKKLFAKHYEHKENKYPKIFISELLLEKMSAKIQNISEMIAENSFALKNKGNSFCYSGRSWPVSYSTYLELARESEYASWVYAFGFRPNHFTVFVNHLKKYSHLQDVNKLLVQNGFVLNSSGGIIKGSPQDLLEQSSTMANEIEVLFDEGLRKIPACYYEFAQRYKNSNGEMYQGFVAQSADKIFESTNLKSLQ